MEFFVLLVICIVLAVFWVYQFIQLMLLSDGDFPGKHDKILWVVAFVFMFFIAPFAFLWWKTAYRMMREEERSMGED